MVSSKSTVRRRSKAGVWSKGTDQVSVNERRDESRGDAAGSGEQRRWRSDSPSLGSSSLTRDRLSGKAECTRVGG